MSPTTWCHLITLHETQFRLPSGVNCSGRCGTQPVEKLKPFFFLYVPEIYQIHNLSPLPPLGIKQKNPSRVGIHHETLISWTELRATIRKPPAPFLCLARSYINVSHSTWKRLKYNASTCRRNVAHMWAEEAWQLFWRHPSRIQFRFNLHLICLHVLICSLGGTENKTAQTFAFYQITNSYNF